MLNSNLNKLLTKKSDWQSWNYEIYNSSGKKVDLNDLLKTMGYNMEDYPEESYIGGNDTLIEIFSKNSATLIQGLLMGVYTLYDANGK